MGAEDGGPGLPVTRWSTEGGDLRIAHFLGLHALQLLPLAGVFLSRRFRPAVAVRLLWILAFAYAGLTAATLVQALRGRPLLQPDALTLGLLGVVAIGTAAGLTAAALAEIRNVPRALRANG